MTVILDRVFEIKIVFLSAQQNLRNILKFLKMIFKVKKTHLYYFMKKYLIDNYLKITYVKKNLKNSLCMFHGRDT